MNFSNSARINFWPATFATSVLREPDRVYKNSETIITEQWIVVMSITVSDGRYGVVAAWIIVGDSCGIFLLEPEGAKAELGFSWL